MDDILGPDNDNSASPSTYMNDMSSYHRLSQGDEPYGGALDKFGDVRLRLAFIDNPNNDRPPMEDFDATDVTGAVNMNTGKVALNWIDSPGGIIGPQELGGQWGYDKNADNYDSDLRTGNEYLHESRKEVVDLTHPFIWSDGEGKWCGQNHVPPAGSKVIVGFRKQGMPLILGYTHNNFNACEPFIKPGEICTKGYGNNYILNRWSDKLDLKAWTDQGAADKDDSSGTKVNGSSCTLWIRLDANNRTIKLSATDANPAVSTTIFLMPDSLKIATTDVSGGSNAGTTTYFQDSKNAAITSETIQLKASKAINMNAPLITQN